MASNPPQQQQPLPDAQSPPLQGRPVGGTERSWCKVVPWGTGITTLAFLLAPSPSPSSLLSALHQLQQHSFPLLRSTLSSSSSNSNLISFSISPHPYLQLHSTVLPPGDDNPTPPPLHLALHHELNLNPWRDHLDSDLLYATLYSLPDHSAILVLRIHTAIADRTSGFAIARRLIGLIGGGWHDPAGGTMMMECVEELIPSHHKKKAFWARGKDILGYSLNFTRSSQLPFADACGERSTDLAMFGLTEPETDKLLTGCKERGIKLCGALTAAVLIAATSYKHHSSNKSETYCTITLVDCRKCVSKPVTDHDIVHSKRRNRLRQDKLNDLAYYMFNLKLKHKEVRKKTMDDPLCLEEVDSDDEWIAELQLCEIEIDAYKELDATVALEEDPIDLEQLVGAEGGIQVGGSRRKRQRERTRVKAKLLLTLRRKSSKRVIDTEEDDDNEVRMKFMDDSWDDATNPSDSIDELDGVQGGGD